MSSNRIRFNRTVFSAPLNGEAPEGLVDQLAAEDIELVIDMRSASSNVLDELCAAAEMYYERRQPLQTEPDAAWAARLALRHRTCILGDPGDARLHASQAVADLVGMRVIDIEALPAPITRPEFRSRPIG